jgi:hypothetical protein
VCTVASWRRIDITYFSWFSWRWRWYVPPKRQFTYNLHGAIFQKIATFIITFCLIQTYHPTPKKKWPLISALPPACCYVKYTGSCLLSFLFLKNCNWLFQRNFKFFCQSFNGLHIDPVIMLRMIATILKRKSLCINEPEIIPPIFAQPELSEYYSYR